MQALQEDSLIANNEQIYCGILSRIKKVVVKPGDTLPVIFYFKKAFAVVMLLLLRITFNLAVSPGNTFTTGILTLVGKPDSTTKGT